MKIKTRSSKGYCPHCFRHVFKYQMKYRCPHCQGRVNWANPHKGEITLDLLSDKILEEVAKRNEENAFDVIIDVIGDAYTHGVVTKDEILYLSSALEELA